MPANLTPDDRRKLVEMLVRLQDFQSVHDRKPLVRDSVAGTARGDFLLSLVDLDGPPRTVASRVIARFAEYGQVGEGEQPEALACLLDHLRDHLSPDHWPFLDDFFFRQGWTAKAPDPGLPGWRDGRDFSQVKEAIIGENTLRHVRYVEQVLLASRAVVRILVRGKGYGTGFMVSPDLLMTNHHVIGDPGDAEQAEFLFFYELDAAGHEKDAKDCNSLSDGFLHADAELDFAFLRLASPPSFGTPLPLSRRPVQANERVCIIQHPGGDYKKISLQNNFVAYADERVLQYYTTTDQGSSGSPVLDEELQVVGIHHQGGMLKEPGSRRHFFRNGGTTMNAVLDDLATNAPGLHQELSAAQRAPAP